MRILCFSTRAEAEAELALRIAGLARARRALGRGLCLGLATGDSPRGLYRELLRLARAGELAADDLTTFNLDEYVGLAADDPHSFRACMEADLFRELGLARERAGFPSVVGGAAEIARAAADYERAIRAAGGIDLQLVGVGRNGHLGFNEPGSARDSRTRLVELHPATREDAARVFGGLAHVPLQAVTMGLATILEARAIALLAFGRAKAALVARTLEEPPGPAWPASWLREHPSVELWLDREAASALDPARTETAGGP